MCPLRTRAPDRFDPGHAAAVGSGHLGQGDNSGVRRNRLRSLATPWDSRRWSCHRREGPCDPACSNCVGPAVRTDLPRLAPPASRCGAFPKLSHTAGCRGQQAGKQKTGGSSTPSPVSYHPGRCVGSTLEGPAGGAYARTHGWGRGRALARRVIGCGPSFFLPRTNCLPGGEAGLGWRCWPGSRVGWCWRRRRGRAAPTLPTRGSCRRREHPMCSFRLKARGLAATTMRLGGCRTCGWSLRWPAVCGAAGTGRHG